MGSPWTPFALPRKGGAFLGENGIEALTSEVYSYGYMRRMRNYHLGREGITKREGTQPYQGNGTAINGSNIPQGFGIYNFGGKRYLYVVCGGKIYYENSGAWTEITGTASLASGQDVLSRFTTFHDGTSGYIIGTDGVSAPWKSTAAGASTALANAPTSARDMKQFQGRVFAIGTDAGDTAVEYSDIGTTEAWNAANIFHCSRASDGIALANHSNKVLVALYEESLHGIRYKYVDTGLADAYFITDPIDETTGCGSRTSVVTYRGFTYFSNEYGIYALRPSQGDNDLPPAAQYISRPLEHFWEGLNPERLPYISAFTRGRPFNEICFLVSTGSSTDHNAVLVYNPEIAKIGVAMFGEEKGREAGWTIFDSVAGYLTYNCGVNWIDSSRRHITLLGGYDGIVDEAFGTPNYSTGYKDNGSAGYQVETELTSGYLGCGNPTLTKGLRQFEMDLVIFGNRSFNLTIYGSNSASASVSQATTVFAPGDLLDTEFTFDESYFAVEGITDHAVIVDGDSRYFQWSLTDSSTERPHSLSEARLMFVPEYIGVTA